MTSGSRPDLSSSLPGPGLPSSVYDLLSSYPVSTLAADLACGALQGSALLQKNGDAGPCRTPEACPWDVSPGCWRRVDCWAKLPSALGRKVMGWWRQVSWPGRGRGRSSAVPSVSGHPSTLTERARIQWGREWGSSGPPIPAAGVPQARGDGTPGTRLLRGSRHSLWHAGCKHGARWGKL